jgi:hypothetical protein
MDVRADYFHLPFKDDSFGAVLMDPPWKVCAMAEIAKAFREALRVAPTLYVYAPYTWVARGFRLSDCWVRAHLGVHHPVMLSKYKRELEMEGEPSEPYGIRPGPGACCPDAHYIDGKCTGCGHEEKG